MTDTVVLIHGTNGSHRETLPLVERLPAGLRIFTPDWLGHGGRPPPREDYGMDTIVDDLVAALDWAKIDRCFLFGYSIGGYAALVLAHRHPHRVRGIVTLATRHMWHEAGVAHLVHLATPERLTRPGNPRAEELARIHHPADWTLVNAANRRLFADLGERPPLSDDDIRNLPMPALTLNGDRDALVPVGETRALADLFATRRLGLFPGSAHPFHLTPLDDIAATIADFIRDVAAVEATAALASADH